MTERDLTVASIAQMIAPRLFVLCGDRPDEMGFPFGDLKSDVEQRLERQFSPVQYWTKQAEEIAEAIVCVLEQSGELSQFDIDRLIAASAKWAEKWQPE